MNNDYLYRAQTIIEDPRILSIVVSRRAKQLALGGRPMVKCDSENHLDIALLEIAEGKLSFEFPKKNVELTLEEQVLADTLNEQKTKAAPEAKKE
ncbi:MAG: DNA-directed RNA polymerase subunit omega [Victivallaceae bacterium]|nr:DNA-directed RNA polymerase subunit omega [Victivallaceae bacterium]